MPLAIRDARPDDADGPALLHRSSAPYYDAFTGSADRSRRVLEGLWRRRGHTAGYDRCRLAVAPGGEVAGALVAFPAEDGDALARRFLALALVRMPPWSWPHVARHLRAAVRVMPAAPRGSLYVDALAVAEAHRRRGVATALLEDAEAAARRAGRGSLSLDTGIENAAARALYERHGFVVRAETRAPDDRVAAAVGGLGFVSYVKPLEVKG